MRKRSFFEKLTGSVHVDDDIDSDDNFEENKKDKELVEFEDEGELTVDVFQTPTHVVIKTMVAGVKPENLDINISRDMVTIRGQRTEEETIEEGDYFHRELYWGSFSRSILLPCEVNTDEAEASERHGLLTLKLPKIDKERKTKLKVKSY